MKLLYCKNCGDIISMSPKYKECLCKKTSGFYINQENIVYSGKHAICIGINNYSLDDAIINIPLDGKGVSIDAYVIPHYCGSTFKVKSAKKYSENYDKTDLFFKSIEIKYNRDEEIDNIRIGNPFLKLIYKFFSKYILLREAD